MDTGAVWRDDAEDKKNPRLPGEQPGVNTPKEGVMSVTTSWTLYNAEI